MNVHSSFIWDSRKLETTQMPLIGTMSIPWNTRQPPKGTNCGHTQHPGWISRVYAEKSQSQMVTYYMTPFIQHSWNDKIREMTNRPVVAGIRDGSRTGRRGSDSWREILMVKGQLCLDCSGDLHKATLEMTDNYTPSLPSVWFLVWYCIITKKNVTTEENRVKGTSIFATSYDSNFKTNS